jgi:hypothetical protein
VNETAQPEVRGVPVDLHDPTQRADVERALAALAGMVAVRLVPGFDRPVDELHALVVEDRSPKQVVRDVQSLLYTRFDISIDHRVISVVQLAEDDPLTNVDEEQTPPRVALTRVSITQSARDASVTVVVTDSDGVEHVGTTSSEVTPAGQRMAAGAATIQAVDDVVAPATSISLAGLDEVQCGGIDVVLAVIEVRAARTMLTLTGSAVVRRGEIDAAARAVLDALNRVLHLG